MMVMKYTFMQSDGDPVCEMKHDQKNTITPTAILNRCKKLVRRLFDTVSTVSQAVCLHVLHAALSQ